MPDGRSMPAYTEGNRVVFVLPFAWSKGLGASIIYGFILFGLHSDGFGSRHFHPTYAAVFALASAIWLLYVARLRVTTTFDGDEGFVSRKNLLWTQTTLALGEVADIFPVEENVGLKKKSYFAFTRKSNRFGKGWPLTKSFAADSPEFKYLYQAALPTAKRLLVPWAVPDGEDGRAGLPEYPAFYSRDEGRFVRVFRRRIALFLLLGLAGVGYGVHAAEWGMTLLGAAFILASGFFVSSVTLDVDAKEVIAARAFGLWKKTIPFDLYSGLEVRRTSSNGLYGGTVLEMRFKDRRPSLALASVFFTRKLEALAKETEAIVLGAAKREEALRKQTYAANYKPVEALTDLNDRDALRLLDVWESSVRATHAFLEEKDIIEIKSHLADALGKVEKILVVRDRSGVIQGFMGVDGFKVEMLFVSPEARGRGVGGNLLTHAIEVLHARRVDVNEQNAQALAFYERYGFAVAGRSETDDRGLPFPILHLELGPRNERIARSDDF